MAKHFSLSELREKAVQGDVSYDLQRLNGRQLIEGDPEVVDIFNLGNKSEALNWLRSTTPEEMQYGTAACAERLARAAEHAAKAGITLEMLTKEHEPSSFQ